ncbi:hypothetical protein U5N28_13605 [Lysinibacillus telephonicus]|uniref:Uncharacterized protein n=1 Tax=Lysinibacillus telephonicus TaxID=1714840 RepID=A0A3S0QY07_9BACI|nr:hypothetical protein [Lysinibacillus telephonicus]RTQ96087.1 hypothetical protein EKG35_01580 [Lysinibacillus telephonicus]
MGEPKKSSEPWNDGGKIGRIESEIVIDRNSLIINQKFCVNAIVGAEQKLIIEEVPNLDEEWELTAEEDSFDFQEEIEITENIPIRQDYTLIYASPSSPIRSPLLMTVIARNLSENDVLVSIEDDQDALVEEVVPANSELALTAQNANFIRALALAPSHVQFFINVFHPTGP